MLPEKRYERKVAAIQTFFQPTTVILLQKINIQVFWEHSIHISNRVQAIFLIKFSNNF